VLGERYALGRDHRGGVSGAPPRPEGSPLGRRGPSTKPD
jgi:hypothetical protein